MANEQLWNARPSAETLIATDGSLKNLADGAIAVTAADDNGTDLDTRADFELYLHDFAAAPDAGAVFQLHICYEMDASNYCDGEDGDMADPNLSANTLMGIFNVLDSDEDQRIQLLGVPLSPHDFTAALVNLCGTAIPNTNGSFLKMYKYNYEVQ